MKLFEMLDRPIAFQRSFVRVTGSINAALMLSQAIYWMNRTTIPGGWFYKSAKDWEEETGMSRHQQDTARKLLRERGILEETLRGVPSTVHFRVDEKKLRECLLDAPSVQFAGNRQTGLPESGKLDGRKPANWIAGKRQTISETTSETTAESTAVLSPESESPEARKAKTWAFREAFASYYLERVGAPAPWDAKEATNLMRWLKKNPTITVEQWKDILRNRAASPVNHAMELSTWIGKALTWLKQPGEEFGRVRNPAHATGKVTETAQNLGCALERLRNDHGRPGGDGVLPAGSSDRRLPRAVLEAPRPRIVERRA